MSTPGKSAKSRALGKKCDPNRGLTKHRKWPCLFTYKQTYNISR